MVFQVGKVGNPAGSSGRKLFVDAIHNLVSLPWSGSLPELPIDGSQKIMHAMAHKLVSGAMRDDWKPGEALAYMQEICDRAYGRPKQTLTGGDEDDKPLIPEKIEVVFVRPNAVTDS